MPVTLLDSFTADRGRFRTNAAGVDKRFRDIDSTLVCGRYDATVDHAHSWTMRDIHDR
jgi:hypothetical protein